MIKKNKKEKGNENRAWNGAEEFAEEGTKLAQGCRIRGRGTRGAAAPAAGLPNPGAQFQLSGGRNRYHRRKRRFTEFRGG